MLDDQQLDACTFCCGYHIKPFVIGRKNYLFVNTPGGAQNSAVIFGLIGTAKENGERPGKQ